MADYSYLGSGKTYLREIGGGGGLIEVGNASALNFAVTEDVKELKDFTQPGGGTFNEVRRISAVECQITMHNVDAANLARALYGSTSANTGAAVSGEAVVVYDGAFAPFAKLPNDSVAPAVTTPGGAASAWQATQAYTLGQYAKPVTPNGYYYKVTAAGTSGGSEPTWPTTVGATVVDGTVTWTCAGKTTVVANTDYEVRAGGLFIYAGSTIDGESWSVDYTSATFDVVEALTTSGKEYELLFDGLNEARSGKKTRVRAWRVKVGALSNLPFIGEDYAGLEVSGKVLKDTTIVGANLSQYFKVEIEA